MADPKEPAPVAPSSPVQTGFAAFGGGAIGPVIVWLCQACHVTPPPDAVAATIGAILLMTVHWLANRYLNLPAPQPKDAAVAG